MKIKLSIPKEFEVKYLMVKAGVRYWDDAKVEGVKDDDGDLIPCRIDDYWCPIIDLAQGKIINWIEDNSEGVNAEIYYKVCDDGTYALLDQDMNAVVSREWYVPNLLCPDGDPDGDCIIMSINHHGCIANWKVRDFDYWAKADDAEFGPSLLAD